MLNCVWLFVNPWTVVYQAPQSMEFSRQEYWSGLPYFCNDIFLIILEGQLTKLDFIPIFSSNVFFCTRIQPKVPCLYLVVIILVSSNLRQSLRFFLFFNDLIHLKVQDRYYVECPPVWVHLRFFSWLDQGLDLGDEYHRGEVSFSSNSRGTHNSMMILTLINWSGWYLAGFSTSKVLFSSFHILFFRSSAHLKGRRIQLHLLEGKRSTYIIYLYYLELCKEDSCFLPHSYIYSTTGIRMDLQSQFIL